MIKQKVKAALIVIVWLLVGVPLILGISLKIPIRLCNATPLPPGFLGENFCLDTTRNYFINVAIWSVIILLLPATFFWRRKHIKKTTASKSMETELKEKRIIDNRKKS